MGDMGIDFTEFAKLWEALHGEGEAEIRKEFGKLDTDNSGFITKDEMVATIASGFTGDKQRPRLLLTSWMWIKMERFLILSLFWSRSTKSRNLLKLYIEDLSHKNCSLISAINYC